MLVDLARCLPALPAVDNRPKLCGCTHTKASLLTAYRHCLLSTTSHGRVPGRILLPGRAGASLPTLPPVDRPSPRIPGNHIHGNGLPATFVPGRRNVCEGYWAVDESSKKHSLKSTSQILRVYLTGIEKRVREAQH